MSETWHREYNWIAGRSDEKSLLKGPTLPFQVTGEFQHNNDTGLWFPKCPLTKNHIVFGKTEAWSRSMHHPWCFFLWITLYFVRIQCVYVCKSSYLTPSNKWWTRGSPEVSQAHLLWKLGIHTVTAHARNTLHTLILHKMVIYITSSLFWNKEKKTINI